MWSSPSLRLPRVPIRFQLFHEDDVVVRPVVVRDLVFNADPPEAAFLERLDRPLVLREGPQLRVMPPEVVEHDLEEELHRLRPVALPPEFLLPEADAHVRAHVLPVPGPDDAPADRPPRGLLVDHV